MQIRIAQCTNSYRHFNFTANPTSTLCGVAMGPDGEVNPCLRPVTIHRPSLLPDICRGRRTGIEKVVIP